MKKIVTIISLLLLCCSCSVKTPIIPELTITDVPSCNEISVADIGNTIVSKSKLYINDSIVINSSFLHSNYLFSSLTIGSGTLLAKEQDTNWIYYYPKNGKFKISDSSSGESYQSGNLRIHKRKEKKDQLILKYDNNFYGAPKQQPIYTHQKVTDISQPSFKQELIYNGRVGNNVKFLYREFSNDLIRPAFTQEIQYEFNNDEVFGFKGVRFMILEATNTHVKYKVIKGFPDRS